MSSSSASRLSAAVLFCLIGLVLVSAKCSGGPIAPPRRVVLISIDGLAVTPILEALLAGNAPEVSGFQRLIDEGASTLNARADPNKTRTLPGHFGILTGRYAWWIAGGATCHPNEHLWFFQNNVDYPDSGLQEINAACNRTIESTISMASRAGLTTRMVASKGPCQEGVAGRFCHVLHSWCPTRIAGDPDCHFDDWLITEGDYDAIESETLNGGWKRLNFIHHGLVDNAGHDPGISTPEYTAALEQVSDWLHLVLDQVPLNAVVIVTSDHGHGGGPGKAGPAECTNPNGRSHTCEFHIQNMRVPLFVWDRGSSWPAGADLYDLLPLCDPGDAWVSQHDACQPIRIQHAAQIVSGELHIDPPPGAIEIE